MPKEKINLGLATYGRSFKLADSAQTGVGAPGLGPGDPGNYTREPGFLAYFEVSYNNQSTLNISCCAVRSVRN